MALTRTFVLPALLLMLALPLSAGARSLDAPKAPPTEPVYEVDPGDRPGYTHVIGHWEWTGDNFMWSPGKWVADKEGSVWVADNWSQRGKKWHLTPGHYESDGSIVPVSAEANDAEEHESIAEHPDTAAEDAKERSEPKLAKDDEMDDVEQKVLAPSKKPMKPASKTKMHKTKRVVVKKPDYNDPTQFTPVHHAH